MKRENGIVATTLGTYPISSVKRILHNGQTTPDCTKIYGGMISTSPFWTLGLIACLVAAVLYQGNHDRKYKLI